MGGGHGCWAHEKSSAMRARVRKREGKCHGDKRGATHRRASAAVRKAAFDVLCTQRKSLNQKRRKPPPKRGGKGMGTMLREVPGSAIKSSNVRFQGAAGGGYEGEAGKKTGQS